MSSAKHHHKSSSTISSEPVETTSKPLSDAPSRPIHHHEVAELAYSYWVERGFCTVSRNKIGCGPKKFSLHAKICPLSGYPKSGFVSQMQ